MSVTASNLRKDMVSKADVLQQLGVSNSTLHNYINAKTFPPSFRLAGRQVYWWADEVTDMLLSRAQGLSEAQLKKRVSTLTERRKERFSLLVSEY